MPVSSRPIVVDTAKKLPTNQNSLLAGIGAWASLPSRYNSTSGSIANPHKFSSEKCIADVEKLVAAVNVRGNATEVEVPPSTLNGGKNTSCHVTVCPSNGS